MRTPFALCALAITLFSGCATDEKRVIVGLPHDRNFGAPADFVHGRAPRGLSELQQGFADGPVGSWLGKYWMWRKGPNEYLTGADGTMYRREGRLWLPLEGKAKE